MTAVQFDDVRYPDGVCRDPACTEHPHCVCGAQLDDDGSDRLVCPECGTSVLAGDKVHDRADASQ